LRIWKNKRLLFREEIKLLMRRQVSFQET